jgi:hypothetical protein
LCVETKFVVCSTVFLLCLWFKDEMREEVRGKKGKFIQAGPLAFPMWKLREKSPDAHKMFGFTKLAIELNEMEENICLTDSRYRPDIRLLERGQVDEAGREKHRLEEKQRAAKRTRDSKKEQWTPRWFVPHFDSDTNTTIHRYMGGYWRSKLKGKFSDIPDIY